MSIAVRGPTLPVNGSSMCAIPRTTIDGTATQLRLTRSMASPAG
jgi:hypothetical protein